MAVSPVEEAQIGHYEQIKRNYAEAWRRYERALAAGAPARTEPESAAGWLNQLVSPRGIGVFQFACLMKLGRHDEARARLESFRQAYPPRLPAAGTSHGQGVADGSGFPLDQPWFREAMQPGGICLRLLQDLYIAQVLLSLDASDLAREHFRSVIAVGSAETDATKLSAAVVLSQVLLLEGKHDEYAELATETLAPLLLKQHRALSVGQASGALDLTRQVPDLAGGLALLPLSSGTFLAGLSRARLTSMVPRWELLLNRANDDLTRGAIDLVLEASYRQLGRQDERRKAVERLEHNPALGGIGAPALANQPRGVNDEIIALLRGLLTGAAPGVQPGVIGQ